MSQEMNDLYDDYHRAEEPMVEILNSSGLTSNQRVVLGQLAAAIVDGRTASEENANAVVSEVLGKCKELGIPEGLIRQFQSFGNEWADKLYPRL